MNADFFIEMAWKSSLIAGAALMLAWALRSRSPADRAMVLRVGVAALLLLPVIAFGLPALEIEAWAAPELATAAASIAAPAPQTEFVVPMLASLQPAETSIWDDPTPLILIAYLGGLCMAGAHLFAGVLTLRRWTAGAKDVVCPEWLAAFDRVRWSAPRGEKLRLMVSEDLSSPVSWGWVNPVILIDPDTLEQPEDAAAILAHEVAHVARQDWPALILSRLVAALFWFNPLVWKLEREAVQQAEEAADCHALDCVEPSRYAETLLSWAQANAALPANSIAPTGSALSRRLHSILDGSLRSRPAGSPWTAFAILACIGVAAPVAALELVEARPVPPAASTAPIAPAAPVAAPAPIAPSAPAPAAAPTTPEAITVTARAPLPPATALVPVPTPVAAAAQSAVPATPAVPQPPRALVPVETLVTMRIHGIDASFISRVSAIGPQFAHLSTDDLVAFRVHGVTPEYIRSMVDLGYRSVTAEQLVAMKIHGVTARRARRAAERDGLPSIERLVEMAIHGEI